jgi:hypothetical protein
MVLQELPLRGHHLGRRPAMAAHVVAVHDKAALGRDSV